MPTARLIRTRGELENENRQLRAELVAARGALQALVGSHDWAREADTGIYRCRECGVRARSPGEVLISCDEWRADGRRHRGRGSQPQARVAAHTVARPGRRTLL